ncbi:glycoside hydrolase family 3 N-terminal domain-containing protein [Mangrovibacterium diazotrophicum]|uniref:beta-glucosidase n=1 Tax=Mangrovibacterium diazotrophicum TaxID=1261403 RepID=A0A419W603_9BACT|nr:glycoside hydrolase family 3 N-terminal domain-containing protein [Mangrovibacterium diazotrophicum]RKD90877.1 beta-glucosidase [Mangrovibacterium diazotrophicum]
MTSIQTNLKLSVKSVFYKGLFVLGIFTLLILFGCISSGNRDDKFPVYKDKNAPIESRVRDLMGKMTLDEKIYQLMQVAFGKNMTVNNLGGEMDQIPPEIGSLIYVNQDPIVRNALQKRAVEESRLGIPILFANDIIHGFKTIYPISLGQACSWNPEIVKQACTVAAKESRSSGIDWTFSPMVDVARDPRWGRVAEGYGEDPYTNAVFSIASVQGYQGDDLADENSIAACLKHYVGYGASEGGRDYVYTEISKQTLWDTYLPPFEAGVNAGAATIMSGFHDISGVPASANHYTLTAVLKEKWGFNGFVVSDWNSIKQLKSQGVAGSDSEAALKSITAGVDMDMADGLYLGNLAELIKDGSLPIERLDDAVRRVLRLKFQLALFDRPYVVEASEEERYLLAEYLSIAERLAEESSVLLKNEHKTLPISKNVALAIIGPMAKEQESLLGSWSAHGEAEDVISIYEAMKQEFPESKITYAKGCDFEGIDKTGFSEALNVARKVEVVILCLGEKKSWSGENASRSTISLPEIQEDLLLELSKLDKPIVLLLSNGRPLALGAIEPNCQAIVEMWQPGVVGGTPVAGIISGRINPSGKLAMTFPFSTGQIPIYYNMRQQGRPRSGKYQDITNKPLYEFTHGLTYTSFKYGDLKANKDTIQKSEKLVVEIPIANMGDRDGAETAHWFVTDPVSSISRPVKELKYFEKKNIKVGEVTVFRFEIDPMRDLSYVDETGTRILESGEYYISVKNKKLKITVVD